MSDIFLSSHRSLPTPPAMFAMFSIDYPMLPFSQRLVALLSAIVLTGTAVASLVTVALTLFPA